MVRVRRRVVRSVSYSRAKKRIVVKKKIKKNVIKLRLGIWVIRRARSTAIKKKIVGFKKRITVRSSKNLFFAPLQEKVTKGFKGQKKKYKGCTSKGQKAFG